MGGILIIFAVTTRRPLGQPGDRLHLADRHVMLGYGLIGFLDDYRKLTQKNSRACRGSTGWPRRS